MQTIQIGDNINNSEADLTLPATDTSELDLKKLKGRKFVIYFYPKDNTPGCTTEGENFRDAIDEFNKHQCDIFGVSKDSVKKHQNFRKKYKFPFELISDSEEKLCRLFDVIKLKKLYGKEYLGIERSTFLFDSTGELRQQWRKVKVKGHVDEVLEAVKAL